MQKKDLNTILTNFTNHLDLYMKACGRGALESEKEREELAYSGMYLLEAAILSCKMKDKFDFYYSPGHAMSVEAVSRKTGGRYYLYLDMCFGTVSFSTDIRNAKYIKNLQDSFIVEFFAKCNEYDFKYDDENRGTSGETIFNASIKSNVFRLFRNYTSDVLSDEAGLDVFDNHSIGSFQKEWELYSLRPIQEIYNELCIAMGCFYKFNYHLWKAQSSEDARKVKKARE